MNAQIFLFEKNENFTSEIYILGYTVKSIKMTDQLRQKFENLELNAGLGKISAFISMSLGLLAIFGEIVFLHD